MVLHSDILHSFEEATDDAQKDRWTLGPQTTVKRTETRDHAFVLYFDDQSELHLAVRAWCLQILVDTLTMHTAVEREHQAVCMMAIGISSAMGKGLVIFDALL